MKTIDPAVKRETVYIGTVTLLLSLFVQAIFLLIGNWDYTVLLGNFLGFVAAVGNFFLMGLAVQSAVKKEEKAAKSTLQLSQTLRFFLLFAVALVGYLAPCFNILAVVIPYVFPRIGVALRPVVAKGQTVAKNKEETTDNS